MTETNKDVLLTMKGLRIEGHADEEWTEIVKGHRPHAAQGRGAGSYRRERRGQVHHRACRHGFRPGRLPHLGRRDHLRRDRPARGLRARAAGPARQAHRLCRAIRPPPASTPAHKLIDQICRGAGPAPRHEPVRSGTRRGGPLSPDAASEPRGNRISLPPPPRSSGGQLQRAMTAMAMSLPARPDHLRRAHHRARRDHADRGSGPRSGISWNSSDTAAIYITHDLAVVAQDGQPHQGVAPGRRGRGSRHAASCWTRRRRTTPSPSGPCAASPVPRSRLSRRA